MSKKNIFIISLIIILFFIASIIIFTNINNYSFLFISGYVLFLFLIIFWILQLYTKKVIESRINKILNTIIGVNNDKKITYHNEKTYIETIEEQIIKWVEENRKQVTVLKNLEEYRREFIGNVSHELKTPVFNIQGYILTLLEGAIEDNSVNKLYLKKAYNNIERMIAIIDDLQTISKLESGEIKLKITRFDIISLTKECIEFLEDKAKQKNIKITIVWENNYSPIVEADKDNIRQVLINLIDNSIKYGINGGYIKIKFSDMSSDILLIQVIDNGIGIEKQYINRIFERFYRIDKSRSRQQGGSGLGLSIVKHIIDAHGQIINVQSVFGEGTTFNFTLKKAK